jgi:transcriptional regulator with XRE-family HTH domain
VPRVFTRWERQDDGMSVERVLALGDVIKHAREEQGIALRELARRSGVSAGQISRIEAGEVERPSRATLTSLATALGRSPVPLLYLAGHVDDEELRQYLRRFESAVEDRVGFVDEMEAFDEQDDAGQAHIMWDLTANLRGLVQDLDPEAAPFAQDLEEVAATWPSLTDERRRLVRAFIADQAVLSQLDRMPSPPGRYQVSIELLERSSDA